MDGAPGRSSQTGLWYAPGSLSVSGLAAVYWM
jgi:hypothetical protein